MQQEIIDILLKKAKGYTYDEQQDEYTVRDDGEMVLIRRKIAKKYSLPDSGALRMYLDICGERNIETYTDEELFNARESLRKELFEYMKEEYNKNLSKKEEQEENTDNYPTSPSDNSVPCDASDISSADSESCDINAAPSENGVSSKNADNEEANEKNIFSNDSRYEVTDATRAFSLCVNPKTHRESTMYSQVRGSPQI